MSDFDFGFGKQQGNPKPGSGQPPEVPVGTIAKGVIGLVIIVFTIMVLSSSFVVVQPGTIGVVTKFGAVQDDMLPEGLHMIMPIQTKVIPVDVRMQKVVGKASASSKDLQVVTSGVSLNYILNKAKVNTIFQELGPSYIRTVIEPAIQESVKSATAQFNAEQLITKRSEVKNVIFEDIRERLVKYNIIVSELSITDFNFSGDFNQAIEDKQVAEQRALRSKNDLDRVRIEADQAIAKANGEAEAIIALAKAEAESQRLMRQTLTPNLIQLRAIEKWDGKLPGVNGAGSVPFINMKSFGN